MELLRRAYAYNRRANEVVTGQLSGLTPEQRGRGPAGITTSPNEFFAHLTLVEWAFLSIVTEAEEGPRPADDMPFEEAAGRLAAIDAAWESFLARATEGLFAEEKFVPWFKRSLRVEDAALQCLLHSHQHRTDLRWALYHYGIETPDADYIMFALGFDIGRDLPRG